MKLLAKCCDLKSRVCILSSIHIFHVGAMYNNIINALYVSSPNDMSLQSGSNLFASTLIKNGIPHVTSNLAENDYLQVCLIFFWKFLTLFA